MLKLLVLLFPFAFAYAQDANYLFGGFYSSQADAAVARVSDATAPLQNPAGLSKIKKDELSSGASSFNLTKEETKKIAEMSSNALHVSYVKGFDDFNLGLAIYTVGSRYDNKGIFTDKINSEGYPSVFSSSTISNTERTFYAISFAPKNTRWGMSFALFHFNQVAQASSYKHQYSQTDLSKRTYKSSSVKMEISALAAGASLGFQDRFGPLFYGFRLDSPFYIVSQKSKVTVTGLAAGATGATDTYFSNYQGESEIEFVNSNVTEPRIKAGAAYFFSAFVLEADFELTAAALSENIAFKNKEALDAGVWQSQTNTYTQNKSSLEGSGGSTYFKAATKTSVGVQWRYNKLTKIGVGALYIPTESKDAEGLNTLVLTTGISRSYKNYLGSFSLAYTSAKDAGGNVEYNENTEKDEKIDLSYETLGLLFSGSYFF